MNCNTENRLVINEEDIWPSFKIPSGEEFIANKRAEDLASQR